MYFFPRKTISKRLWTSRTNVSLFGPFWFFTGSGIFIFALFCIHPSVRKRNFGLNKQTWRMYFFLAISRVIDRENALVKDTTERRGCDWDWYRKYYSQNSHKHNEAILTDNNPGSTLDLSTREWKNWPGQTHERSTVWKVPTLCFYDAVKMPTKANGQFPCPEAKKDSALRFR